MRGVNPLFLAGAALLPFYPATAAETLKFAPPPPWVVPLAIPAASDKAADQPVAILLHDQQTELERGKVSTYSAVALKIQKPEGLAAGNLSVAWNPATDTVTVHKVEIHRGDQVIDVLRAGQTFTTMRRESNLEQAMLDGVLTANIQPEGLQQGDVVVLSTTTERVDPVLKGHVETIFAPWASAQIALAHTRLQWPSNLDVRVRTTGDLPPPKQSVGDGRKTYELTMSGVQPVIAPKNAPVRFGVGRIGEATDFRSWADAAALMIPLYRDAAVIPASGPLRDEVERIRKASSDPKSRAEQALQLVQQRVRYVALLMGEGGYVPATPQETWSRRFGDCKAKTALLLALLREFGIEAEPVLVNPMLGDAIAERLPMISLFNHVLVRARINGNTYWLDGTRTGDNALDRVRVPNFGWGLPLVERAELVRMVPPPLTTPDSERRITVDASAGAYAPATIAVEEIFRGDSAVVLDALYSQLSAEQRSELLRRNARRYFDSMSVESSSVDFDKATGELRIKASGKARLEWKDGWYNVPSTSLAFDPDFDRVAGPMQQVPFATSYPEYDKNTVTIRLPRDLAARQELPADVQETLAGVEYRRKASLSGDVLTFESSERSIAPEVPYKSALAEAPRLRALERADVHLQVSPWYTPTALDLNSLRDNKPASVDEYLVRGGALLAHNKVEEGIADLTAALELDPKNVWALTKRASAYIGRRQLAEAEKDLRAADAIEADNYNALGQWAELTVAKGNANLALTYYEKAIARNPKNHWAKLRRAGVLRFLGKEDEALRDVNEILAADPNYGEALSVRAEMLASRREWAAAEKDVAAALSLNPEDTIALATKAWIALERKDFDTALKLVSKVLERDPNNSFARNLRTRLLNRSDNQAEAIRALDEAVARAPRDKSVLLDRAYAHLQAKNFEAAEKDLAAVLAIAPADPLALQARGTIAMARSDYPGAVAALTAAIEAFPSNGPALVQRAEAYRQMRQYAPALADTEAALKTGLVSPQLRLLRINIRLQQGDLTGMTAETEKMIEENPTSDFALVAAGKIFSTIGMNRKAMESFERAIALKPYAYIYLNRAQARPHSEVAEKLADLDAALKLEPDSVEALGEKASLLSRQGRHAEAIALYDRAIGLAIDSSYLKLLRGIALARGGRADEARKAVDEQRAKAKTAADFNQLCWVKATNDVMLESALEDCREALRKDPDFWAATDSLGMVLLKLGKLQDALAAFNKGIAHQSGAEGHMGRAFVYERMGDSAKARADLEAARKLRPNIDSQYADYGLTFDKAAAIR